MPEGRLDGQWCVGGDSVGGLEGAGEKPGSRHEFIQKPHRECSLRVDWIGCVEEPCSVGRGDLTRWRHGRRAVRVEPQRDFFEGESSLWPPGSGSGLPTLNRNHRRAHVLGPQPGPLPDSEHRST